MSQGKLAVALLGSGLALGFWAGSAFQRWLGERRRRSEDARAKREAAWARLLRRLELLALGAAGALAVGAAVGLMAPGGSGRGAPTGGGSGANAVVLEGVGRGANTLVASRTP